MKQIQFNYESDAQLLKDLKKIKQWCNASITSKVLFQIYTETLNHSKIQDICQMIEKKMPEAIYMGCSTNGNIVMGEYNGAPIAIICTIFEYPSTKIELFQYVLNDESETEVTTNFLEVVKDRKWVKAIMLNATIRGLSMTKFCEDLSKLPEGIGIFGGGAFSKDIIEDEAFVFSSSGGLSDHAVVFALIGGEDYYVKTTYITGWKPLGRELHVTKADRNILYKLDGKPAYDTYYKYLNIKNDDNFFLHTLEFPFFYEHKDINILRAPTASNEDGSLTMTADMEENVKARIAYGDPETILDSVYEGATDFREFVPEIITVFSCAARRSFWGSDEVGKETLPFQSLAPTSGFYTSGEFLRNGNDVIQHNVTLVIGVHREGIPEENNLPVVQRDIEEFSGKVSMINRLATFIQVATEELEEANERLKRAAITDSLTGLYNRGEIQKYISEKAYELEQDEGLSGNKAGAALIMLDIDYFKRINDTYGHKEGDIVLQMLAKMLRTVVSQESVDSVIGRWGGEEFMVLLPSG